MDPVPDGRFLTDEETQMPAEPTTRAVARASVAPLVGFGLSMAVLAVVALWSIPEMIHASGPAAWGAIATGQAVGMVSAVVLYLGWGVSGPADVARAGSAERWRRYVESLRARGALAAPVLLATAGVAALVARHHTWLAVLAACCAATIGLTAAWYFVGTVAPYRLFVYETLPRAAGTLLGILAMRAGSGAEAGLLGQLAGMVAGVAACSLWIRHVTRLPAAARQPIRPVGTVLREQGAGVTTSALGAAYTAVPVVIVGLTVPSALASFALLDKLQKQAYVALQPVQSVLQGWVPRAPAGGMHLRVRRALAVAACAGVLIAAVVALTTPWLVQWLGAGHVETAAVSAVLVGLLVATNLFESAVSRAALVPLGRIRTVARLTALGALVGLLLVPVGAHLWGTPGALLAVLVGLLVRVVGGLLVIRSTPEPVRLAEHDDPTTTQRATQPTEQPVAEVST